jgi:sugar lactone lactonase YvrE
VPKRNVPKPITARPFFRPNPEELRYLPECPRILGDSLLWISIQYSAAQPQGGINVLNLATLENVHHALPARPGFFALTADPSVVVIGLEDRLVLYDFGRTAITETLAQLSLPPRVIINDGIDIPGGLIFGTKDTAFRDPIAALHHYDQASRTVRQLLAGQICSNGKYLHDGLLIDIDTQPKTITEYHYDGRLHAPRLVTPPGALPAFPDGLCPMPDGESIIVAFYNDAHVPDGVAQEIRLRDGIVLTEWTFPGSPRVTCPAIGHFEGEPCVFFTTAIEGMPAATRAIAPEAGTIFIAPLNG